MFAKTPKSLSSILSSFNKTIEELTVLQEFNQESIERKESLIADLESQARFLRDENDNAARVQLKIRNLVN